jgi:hypothetical protein
VIGKDTNSDFSLIHHKPIQVLVKQRQLLFLQVQPGGVSNILTGGAATQTNAGTHVVTANFVPTDLANYNSLLFQQGIL